MSIAAVCTGKVRMTLLLRAVVGQLEMRGSFVHERLMHKPDPEQAFERSVDSHLVEMFPAAALCNLVLAQRPVCFEQNFQYGHSVPGAVKFRRLEHFALLCVRIRPHEFFL